MTAATKHLHKRVLNLEIGDDEDPIFPAPNTPEAQALHQQGMDFMQREGDLMRRRVESIAEWATLHEAGDDLTDCEARWRAVEKELSENRLQHEELQAMSQKLVAESLARQRRELTATKAARLRGQA
ncbi:hypothetical protein RCF98_14285 [Thiothrix lacustris]|uniref:Uncharacterized protein n=1 Tax=Thiothrix lacustris TaxID=525917 RepID=A0ABY9MN96_9GAMM|nr:hypothetical protein [Thiothrix lacustris]WML90131.1 hypothetical protein RCF98_14285 [Thiothrix lacustris]